LFIFADEIFIEEHGHEHSGGDRDHGPENAR
jgi:hypothetical protein